MVDDVSRIMNYTEEALKRAKERVNSERYGEKEEDTITEKKDMGRLTLIHTVT